MQRCAAPARCSHAPPPPPPLPLPPPPPPLQPPRGRRALLLLSSAGAACGATPCAAAALFGGGAKPGASYNLDEARRRGEAARAAREDAEPQGTLVELPSGLRYRELARGARGPAAALGDTLDLLVCVYRLAPGAYFKYSGGGSPVLLFALGYGSEGQDDVGVPFRTVLGAPDALPRAVPPALVGMRAGGKRRVLVPPALGWTSERVRPRPPTFGAARRLANHADEPLLFEAELLRVRRAGGDADGARDDADGALALPDGAARYRAPLPPALSPAGATRQATYER